MSTLFPPIEPYKTEMFPVSDVHTLSIKQYGNKDGKPVVFVHGGPGGGCDAKDARRFDPQHYRIILFDQRGSGDSTPLASLEDNTTPHLIEDMEKIRQHLGIEKWHVFGGSWGSTLSLAYSQTHPDRVKSLVLRGIFTLRRSELDFFYNGPGTSDLFPEYWDDYLAPIPENERNDMITAYYKRLTSEDPKIRAEAGRAWSRWEMATSRIEIDEEYLKRADEPGFADAFARIECHYFINAGFFPQDGYLLLPSQIDKIRHIPTTIIQGRYDVVCPAKTAWDLHKVFPEAKFEIVTAGHSSAEKEIEERLIRATDEFKKLD
ncbi:uncharacterized protein JCM6883_003441 [Sporobolomyces salmoneus]|uniref:uncharacterized protein n=1 Tax=Sporobolomyces salmoneus TaxID=183962 RepID=UPI00317558FA